MKPLTDHELASLESETKRLAAAVPALATLLDQTLPRLLEQLRAARREGEALGQALEREKAEREKAARDSPARPSARVAREAAAAARTDPLSALAVQVARALSPDAGPVERARLIAMAFAAAQGDLEAFWAARRQRKVATPPNRGAPLRKK